MKYWECIDIPGESNEEELVDDDNTVVDTDDCCHISIKEEDNPSGLKIAENPVPITTGFIPGANGVEAGAAILNQIFGDVSNAVIPSVDGGNIASISLTEQPAMYESRATTPEPDQLDDRKVGRIIDTLYEYQDKYFKEIPIKHISNQFLRNITKDMYSSYLDAVDKFEAPALMNPLLLLYPLFTDAPYMAMGKFWNVIMTKITDPEDSEWCDAILASISDYENYIKMLKEAEEEEAEDEESEVEVETEEAYEDDSDDVVEGSIE